VQDTDNVRRSNRRYGKSQIRVVFHTLVEVSMMLRIDRWGIDSLEACLLASKRRQYAWTRHNRIPATLLVLFLLVAASESFAEWPAWLDNEKIRGTLDFEHVDKRAHFARLADSGVNTLIISFAALDVDKPEEIARLNKQAGWCAELGLHLFVMTRMCGDKLESRHLIPDGRRYVDRNGLTLTKTPCPVDPVFWETVVIKRAQLVAEHSLSHNIDGWCLDPEMYGADYSEFPGHCYCEDCLREFLQDRGLPVQAQPATRRSISSWLQQQKLAGPYEAWQTRQAEALARKAEQAIHKINPDLLIGVLLLDVNKWYYNAWARGFGTAKMPAIAFSESTYSSGATEYIQQAKERLKQIGAHAVVCPGMYLRKFPPEEIASQLFYMAQDSAGYWLFTTFGLALTPEEVPTNGYSWTPPHEQYLNAFRLTGEELDRQAKEGKAFAPKLELVHRRAAPQASAAEAEPVGAMRPVDPKGQSARPATEPTYLRYEAVFYLLAATGDAIAATLTSYAEGIRDDAPAYTLIAPGGEILAEGTLPLNEPPVDLKVAATKTGLYRLGLTTRANLFSVAIDMPHAVQSVNDTVSVVTHTLKTYFYVPQDCAEFFIKVGTPYVAEQARLVVWDPAGKEAANAQTTRLIPANAVVTTTPEQRGRAWSFQILPADHGAFYSGNLIWDPRLPPYLAESPEALLVPVAE